MSGLARVLLDMGYRVSGSDLASGDAVERLRKAGASVFIGHDRSNIAGADVVVVSSAVPPDNPELVAATESGVRVMHRGEVLAWLVNSRYGIAIAGTHGKTTTTSMVSIVLERAGLDPTVIIGGEVSDFGGNAKLGKSKYLVAEADESDGSFLRLRPKIAVSTNVENDHLNHYGGRMENLVAAFRQFVTSVSPGGKAVLCWDDPNLRAIAFDMGDRAITYGLCLDGDGHADLRSRMVALERFGSKFEVIKGKRKRLGVIELSVPGIHNVSNALAATAVGLLVGVDFQTIADALKDFKGAQRRFQTVAVAGGVMVVDDYGHHPTEVKATLRAARGAASGKVICVFQPHRYTRTQLLAEEFGGAFADADVVIVTDIYSAGEPPIPGVHAASIAEAAKRMGHKQALYIPRKEDIVDRVADLARPGDLVITVGAGDIWQVAREMAARFAGNATGTGRTLAASAAGS